MYDIKSVCLTVRVVVRVPVFVHLHVQDKVVKVQIDIRVGPFVLFFLQASAVDLARAPDSTVKIPYVVARKVSWSYWYVYTNSGVFEYNTNIPFSRCSLNNIFRARNTKVSIRSSLVGRVDPRHSVQTCIRVLF